MERSSASCRRPLLRRASAPVHCCNNVQVRPLRNDLLLRAGVRSCGNPAAAAARRWSDLLPEQALLQQRAGPPSAERSSASCKCPLRRDSGTHQTRSSACAQVSAPARFGNPTDSIPRRHAKALSLVRGYRLHECYHTRPAPSLVSPRRHAMALALVRGYRLHECFTHEASPLSGEPAGERPSLVAGERPALLAGERCTGTAET